MFGRGSAKPTPAERAAALEKPAAPAARPAAPAATPARKPVMPQSPGAAAARAAKPARGAGPELSSQLMPEGSKAGRMAAYNFINMYISGDPLAPVMAHGLRSATISVSAFGKGLVQIPEVLQEDAQRLYGVIDRMYKHTNFKREFTVTHDDRPYRCALIGPPDLNFDDKRDNARDNEIRWCIRQVGVKAPSFEDLSLPPETRATMTDLLPRRGLVMVSGPFASGKTTLASSVLDYWVERSRDVGITLEDPPEIPLARVTTDRGVIYQIDLQDQSVREAIKHARRWSPRYLFLGEVRTSDVAGELLHMAISGPLVVCTIHASDPVQAIVSLFRFASSEMSEEMAKDMIAGSLQQVFHQEIRGGRVMVKQAQIHGTDNHLIRSKIKNGNFRGLYEDFDRQAINKNSVAGKS